MQNYNSVARLIAILSISSFFAFSCNRAGNEKEAAHTAANPVLVQVENPEENTFLMQGELPREQVCMVNNAYMGKKQIPVAYANKTYYGCCEMCVDKIKTTKAVRYATDPITGKEVDKASAFIALNPSTNDGSVLYFESAESYHTFKSTAH